MTAGALAKRGGRAAGYTHSELRAAELIGGLPFTTPFYPTAPGYELPPRSPSIFSVRKRPTFIGLPSRGCSLPRATQ
jgi:hypothetical protein